MIREGDFRRAWSYSKSAKQWSIAAIVTGLVFTIVPLVILIILVVVIAAGGGTSNINY